jgi:hypothetical protein
MNCLMPNFLIFSRLSIIAHAILVSIPLIQMVQPGAREAVTVKAVLAFSVHNLLTVLDSTCGAGFRFEAVVTLATGA